MNRARVLGCCVTLLLFGGFASNVEAGPLLDWLMGKNRVPANPQVAYMPATQCQNCTVTCQRQVVNYVPQTSYRTNWVQVPVTSYRPVATTDPVSGCKVTCMRPCTTYRWQAQRVPFTSYRPVVSTVNVQRPLSAMLQGNPLFQGNRLLQGNAGCATCPVPGTVAPTTVSGVLTPGGSYLNNPTASSASPNTTLPLTPSPGIPVPASGGNQINSSIPANNPPTLDPNTLQGNRTLRIPPAPTYSKSILSNPGDASTTSPTTGVPSAPQGVNSPITSGSSTKATLETPQGIQPINDPAPSLRLQPPVTPAPALLPPNDQTALSPIHSRWNYNPVRMASYETQVPSRGGRSPSTLSESQHGWKSLNRN